MDVVSFNLYSFSYFIKIPQIFRTMKWDTEFHTWLFSDSISELRAKNLQDWGSKWPYRNGTGLNIWKFMVHVLLKPGLENFEYYFTSVWEECNCAVIWAFFGIAFLWDWNENWPFPVLWPLLSFPDMLAYWVQHFHSIIFQNCSLVTFNLISFNVFIDVFPSYLKQMLCVVDI